MPSDGLGHSATAMHPQDQQGELRSLRGGIQNSPRGRTVGEGFQMVLERKGYAGTDGNEDREMRTNG